MDLEKFSYIIAIILLVSSIISPIATAIINNIHQSKMKRIQIFEKDKKNALCDFIEAATYVAYNPSNSELELDYQKAFNSLFLYFPNMKLDLIYTFEEYRSKLAKEDNPENYSFANHALTNIVQELSKQITKE